MITLTAKINLLSGDNKALSLGSENLSGNNISSKLGDIVGVKKQGSNPFILGASKLGDGSTFSDGVDYFIGDQLSDDNGNFATPYEFRIKSDKEINSLTLSFDKINKRHPKNISIYTYELSSELTNEALYDNAQTGNVGTTIGGLLSYIATGSIYTGLESSQISSGYITIRSGGGSIRKRSIVIKDNYIDWTVYAEIPNQYVYVTIQFDYYNKERIAIGNYFDDDPIFTLANLPNKKEYLININDWNTNNYPLVMMGIYSEVSIDIDRRNLISISRSIFDRSDLKLPSFGIISNTGNIEFNDIDGEIRDYAEQLLLESGLKCEIFLNNTLANAQERIGLFETDEWDYDNDNRVVSVSLKDDLEEWQDINVAEINYDPRDLESKPFKWFYVELWKLTSNRYYAEEQITGNGNYDMLAFDELNTDTQDILKNTYIQYPLLESGSLWEQWTKLCEVCQLHIYKNSNGVVVCRYNGGN